MTNTCTTPPVCTAGRCYNCRVAKGPALDETAARLRGTERRGDEPEAPFDCINAEDLFYWMQEKEEGDIPLSALGLEIPLCCRFCI